MICDFLNPTIFWEYDIEQLNADEWAPFILKQVFNRNVVSESAAIPALIEYYGANGDEEVLRNEGRLTQEGI